MIEESKDELPVIGISRNCVVHRYNHRQVQRTNEHGVEETFWQCDSIFEYTGKNIKKLPIRIVGVLELQNQNLTQVKVDAVLKSLYRYREEFIEIAPILNIGGNNEPPSGEYRHSVSPETGKEYQYALVNDDDEEGHNKWTIS